MAILTAAAGAQPWALGYALAIDGTDQGLRHHLMEQEEISKWLEELRTEHRDLDDLTRMLHESVYPDRMQLQRLKKRKLRLKDMIAALESKLIPDLDA
jgi:hypothetical protein